MELWQNTDYKLQALQLGCHPDKAVVLAITILSLTRSWRQL